MSVENLPIRRLVVVRTDRLGETLLTLPALSAFRRASPKTQIIFTAANDMQGLLSASKAIDDLLPYPAGNQPIWWVRSMLFAKALRRQQADAVIVCNPMKELHLAVWLARVPRRIGYGRKWGALLTNRLVDDRAVGLRHEVDCNRELFESLGFSFSSDQASPFLFFPPHEQKALQKKLFAAGYSAGHPLIAVHAGTSNPVKCWPLERFRALILGLSEQLNAQVMIIGGVEEKTQAQAIIPSRGKALNLAGCLSLRESAMALGHAAVLISNDSGPVHLSACVGTPVVALFGTTNPATGPARWGPWGSGHKVIWKDSMEAITVDEVLEAAVSYVR